MKHELQMIEAEEQLENAKAALALFVCVAVSFIVGMAFAAYVVF